ncbi:MAG: glycogen/starch synthase [Bacteroidota bacterium]
MKVLFVAGEVAPFSASTQAAHLARDLPEHLQEHAGIETRIIMPRYGTVSERRNRLHEVIRLSGSDISVGETTETLKVKVASIPGIRLQVYFMDNVHYFKRKGIFRDRKTEALFEDNAERALYFGRAALTTVENLGWAPDVVHAVGWIAGYVPALLSGEFAGRDLFGGVKTVYTPDDAGVDVRLTADQAAAYGLHADAADREVREVGAATADAVASGEPGTGGPTLDGEPHEIAERAAAFYRDLVA